MKIRAVREVLEERPCIKCGRKFMAEGARKVCHACRKLKAKTEQPEPAPAAPPVPDCITAEASFEPKPFHLALLTNQPVLVYGLEALLAAENLKIRWTCTSISELMDVMAAETPDVVLMDLTSEIAFDSLSRMKVAATNSKIILWVDTISTEFAFQAMGLGVRGILRKSLALPLIIKCLRVVHAGELWFEKSITDEFLTARRVALTQREGQLVSLLSQGLRNKEIAARLFISQGTVKVYLSRLFDKLHVNDRFELALYGLKNLTSGQRPDAKPVRRPVQSGGLPIAGPRSIVLNQIS